MVDYSIPASSIFWKVSTGKIFSVALALVSWTDEMLSLLLVTLALASQGNFFLSVCAILIFYCNALGEANSQLDYLTWRTYKEADIFLSGAKKIVRNVIVLQNYLKIKNIYQENNLTCLSNGLFIYYFFIVIDVVH